MNEAAPQMYGGDFADTGYPAAGYTYSYSRGSLSSGNGGGIADFGSPFMTGLSVPTDASAVGFIQQTGYLSWSVNGSTNDARYCVALSAAQRSGYAAQDISVQVDGAEVGRFTPGSNWAALRSMGFDLGPGNHRITITGLDSGGGDRTALVDAVRLETLPVEILDGDGHTSNLAPGTYAYAPSALWAFSGSAGVATNNAGFTADGGGQSDTGYQVFLQGNGTATQKIKRVKGGGAHTVLTFSARQRAGNAQSFGVYVDGALVNTVTPASSDYEAHQIDLGVLSKGPHLLSLRGLDPRGGDNSAMITDVSVSQDGYANQAAFTHDAFGDSAIAAVVPSIGGSMLSNYIHRALAVAPDCAQTLSLYTDYRQLSTSDAATLYGAAGGMVLGAQVAAMNTEQANAIWASFDDGSNEQALFLMQLDAYAPDLGATIRQKPEPRSGPNEAIQRVEQVEATGDYSAAATAAAVAALNAWMSVSDAMASLGSDGTATITGNAGVTPVLDSTQVGGNGSAPAADTPSPQYGINNPSAAPTASGLLPVDAYAPLDSAGNPILHDAGGSGWDPYTQSYDIRAGSTLMPDGSVVSSGTPLTQIGHVTARNSALPWYTGLLTTPDVRSANGGGAGSVTSDQQALRAGLWNSLQRQMLGSWLKTHAPRTSNQYAPPGMYCTEYVENVYKLATGYDLKEAVLADMVNGAPAPLDRLRGTTAANGYRYSSIFNLGADFQGGRCVQLRQLAELLPAPRLARGRSSSEYWGI